MKIILFSLTLMFLFVGMIGSVNADGVPEWVKNTAGWWATDAISENEFVNAIEFLVNVGIIGTQNPSHLKNNVDTFNNSLPISKKTINELCERYDKLGKDWEQRT